MAQKRNPDKNYADNSLLKRQEVAHYLQVSPHTVRMYERRGYLSPIRFSKRMLRYDIDDVQRVMSKLRGRKGNRG